MVGKEDGTLAGLRGTDRDITDRKIQELRILKVLSRLPVDALKIDRSFVSQIDSGLYDRTVVETTISLAKALGNENDCRRRRNERAALNIARAWVHIRTGVSH